MTDLNDAVGGPARRLSAQAPESGQEWDAVPASVVVDPRVAQVKADRTACVRWRLRLRGHLSDPFFRNGYALILNSGVTGALGLIFWAIAARTYHDPDVGRGSALISAMTLLSGVVAINLAGTLSRFIPGSGQRTGRLVLTVYGLSSVAVLGLVVGFLSSLGEWGPSFELLRDPTMALWFVAAVVASGIFTLQDGVLVGLRSATWVPVENMLFGIAKIILVVLLVAWFPHEGVYLAWVVPMVLVSVPLNFLIFGRLLPRHAAASRSEVAPPTLRAIGRFFIADYIGALFMFASATLPPVLVAPFVQPYTFAYFYVGWMSAAVLNLIGLNFAASLTVEGLYDARTLVGNCRAALRRGVGLTVIAAVVLGLVAPYGLALFGHGYLDAAPMLQALAIAAIPRTVIDIWVGVLRARSRVREIAHVQIASGGLAVAAVLSWLYVRSSMRGPQIELITGVGLTVLASQIVVALAVVPAMRRFFQEARPQVVSGSTWGASGDD
jgi:O-antigen/teichoic acid export membrane protein